MDSHLSWKCLALLSCLLAVTCAKESQLKLEDIERDSLTSGKVFQQQPIQQLSPRPYFATASAAAPQPPQIPVPQVPQGPPQDSRGPHQFTPDARNFPPPPPLQVQFPSRTPQQQFISVPLYLPQQPQGHDQQFQFLPDNSLKAQDPYNLQQYFGSSSSPQYVYVQQLSNPIPVNDKQGGLQYVQYVDPNTNILKNPRTQAIFTSHNHKANHNLAGLIQRNAYTNVVPQNYRQPAPQTYRVQGQAQPLVNQNVYVVPPPQPLQQPLQQQVNKIPGLYQGNNQVLAQQRFLVPGIVYANPNANANANNNANFNANFNNIFNAKQRPIFEQQPQQSIANAVYEKREPQSLLDSYISSVLQIQYYKQLQKQQENSLPQDNKFSNIVGKTDVVKPQDGFQYQLQ